MCIQPLDTQYKAPKRRVIWFDLEKVFFKGKTNPMAYNIVAVIAPSSLLRSELPTLHTNGQMKINQSFHINFGFYPYTDVC